MGTASEYTLKLILDALGDPATQTTLAALLTELQTKADLTETQPVSAASLPLPSGAATEVTLEACLTQLEIIAADPSAPSGAAYVVTAANEKLTSATIHSALSGDDLHDPKAHNASHAGGGGDKLKYTRQIAFVLLTDPVSVSANVSATIVYRGPTLTLVRWDFRAKTAPVGAAMIADVNVGGTSLWASTQANRPTIADGATSGTGTSFDTTTISAGDVMTLDVDQIGSSTGGGQITLLLEGTCNPATD